MTKAPEETEEELEDQSHPKYSDKHSIK